jgi:threonylcarbamoyladenosine tRNA methylthiotransferase MtaB
MTAIVCSAEAGLSDLSFSVKTFGCKVNTYDTGLLQKRLQAAGFYQKAEEPMVHILNTCAVTHEATKEALRHIRRLRVKSPECTIVVTGCSAQVDGQYLDHLPGADLIVANSHKGDLENIVLKFLKGDRTQKVFRSNIFRQDNLGAGGGEETQHTRSFLKIQDGCNSFCTFCIIPYARGKSRSLSIPHLTQKINELSSQGVNEVVLTGVHIGDYCDEETMGGPYKLEDLLESVLKTTTMPRIRLSSMEPVELNDRLFELYKDPRLCPHFHMSIQSAQSKVLKEMKRNYSAEQVEWALNAIEEKVPGAFVGMDVIVGFPGETDEEFQETYDRLSNLPWTRIHVFPYSERQGTRAALSAQGVPQALRKERSRRLRELSLERYTMRALDQVGRTKNTLILKDQMGKNIIQGLSRDYWPVQISQPQASSSLFVTGREVPVRITGVDTHKNEEGVLFAEVAHA